MFSRERGGGVEKGWTGSEWVNAVSCRSEYFKNSFVPNVANEWNKLNPDIRSCASYNVLRNRLLKFITHTVNTNNSVAIKLLTRLQLSFNHLREHKFRHGFRDMLNPLCLYSIEAKINGHYFLLGHIFHANRSTLMNDLKEDDSSFSTLNDNKFIDLLLYANDKFDEKKNCKILISIIKFNKESQRFEEQQL